MAELANLTREWVEVRFPNNDRVRLEVFHGYRWITFLEDIKGKRSVSSWPTEAHAKRFLETIDPDRWHIRLCITAHNC